MKFLTEKEQSELLKEWSVPEEPYGAASSPEFYTQFYPLEQFRPLQYFVASFLEEFASKQSCLIVFTDWGLYLPREMKLIDMMRSSHGETRALIEAPGHLFSSEEQDLAVNYFSLGVGFGWSAYLYIKQDKTVLFNWEGDILDFWSESKRKLSAMRDLISRYELKYTKAAEPGAAANDHLRRS